MSVQLQAHPSENISSAKLEAILAILSEATTEEELAQAKEQARRIEQLSDEEIQALLAEDKPAPPVQQVQQVPARHVRQGDFLQHLRAPRSPAGHTVEGSRPGSWVRAGALAEFYASLYNDLTEAGAPPDAYEVARATEELVHHGWVLDRDETGDWRAHPVEDVEEHTGPIRHFRRGWFYQYAAQRAPKGGISIAGKFYQGGRFIPASVIEHASEKDKERLAEAKDQEERRKQQKADERKARGPVDKEAILARLSGHWDKHGVHKTDTRKARRSWRAIERYHGETAVHRVQELVETAEAALAKLDPHDKNKQALRNRLGKHLAVLHRMLQVAGEPREQLPRGGKSGNRTGLSGKQRLGTDAGQTPQPDAAGSGQGTGQGSEGLPDRTDPEGDGSGPDAGGAEGAAGDGAGTGAARTADGGTDTAGAMGEGGGAGEHRGRGEATPADAADAALSQPPTPQTPTDLSAGNWRYHLGADGSRNFGIGGQKQKFKDNIAAIKTLKTIKAEGRTTATPEEQAVMAKFVGWGQFPALFNSYFDKEWENERQLLRSLLSSEEFEEASSSTKAKGEERWGMASASKLNAHYTHPDVVKAHWDMARKLGFEGGRYLETSAGIGYYLGLMPADLAARTHASAVELDKTTGDMLKLLYPSANVQVKGFEKFEAPNNFYDLIASNVPFGAYKVNDKDYNKYNANIHDYFFLKSMDKVRPGGLVMHVTSAGTMDKKNDKIRQKLAEQGELVAAIRFPGGTHKENAGTEVVTDMLIFRKKHPHEGAENLAETPTEAQPEKPGFTGTTTDSLGRVYYWVDGKRVPGPRWDDLVDVPNPSGGPPITINRYFAEHPEQVLGTITSTGTMHGPGDMNVEKGADYQDRLQAAIDRLPAGILKKVAAPRDRFTPDVHPAEGDTKDGGYKVRDGKLYVREGGGMVEQQVPAKTLDRIAGHLSVRDALRKLINDQLQGRDSTQSRQGLHDAYDAFVKKHGYINDPANKKVFRTDPDHPRLLALEDYDPATKKAGKADIFHKDKIRPRGERPDKADNHIDALGICLNETGRIDIDRIAHLLRKSPEEVGRELVARGLAYEDPQKGWEPANHYLSGNVRRKLVLAQAAAAADPKFQPNVDALLKVQPADIDHADIGVRMGAPWVPASDYKDFIASLLDTNPDHFKVGMVPSTGEWLADFGTGYQVKWVKDSRAAQYWQIFNEDKVFKLDAMDIMEAALNNTSLFVTKKAIGPDNKEIDIPDEKATRDANARVQEMRDKFRQWVWEGDERRERLHRFYNDNFNNIVRLKFDGSHQTFPGMNAGVELYPHQKNFVWQAVTTGGGLAAHEVGSGKTKSLVASAMEMRRLGLAKKPCMVVKKANIEQITREAMELYPGAKILSTAEMFDKDKRKQTIARIATGDYDLVIMTHDHMGLLAMSPERVQAHIRGELEELEAMIVEQAMADLEANKGKRGSKQNRITSKLEKAKKNLEAKLEKALASPRKDDAVYFEETGIDSILVDEAHEFKSLPVRTKKQNLKGVPTSDSQKATNMLLACRYLQENNGGRGVIFATGTPVANTLAELYNLQRYLQPQELKDRGIESFDAWCNTFAEAETRREFTVSGEYKPVTRLSDFVNIPELSQMTGLFMDVQKVDMLKRADGTPIVTRPKRKDAMDVAPLPADLEAYMKDIVRRANSMKGKRGKGADNMLKICSDGRKAALDMRLVDSNAKDNPDSKVNRCIANVLETAKTRPGVCQLIFSDTGVNPIMPGGAVREVDDSEDLDAAIEAELEGDASLDAGAKGAFHLYGDIINKLVAGGIPREKIADFSKLEGAKKEAAMQAMRKGEILIGIGSTKKLGTGVNVQDKLGVLHHLDVPWTPADIEQRDGRGHRQGNRNDPTRPINEQSLDIRRYVAEKSLDQAFWGIIGRKAKMIGQVITQDGELPRHLREEDGEELTPAQLMAAASGDPRIMEKVDLEDEIKSLTFAQDRHQRDQIKHRDSLKASQREIANAQKVHDGMVDMVDTLDANPDFHLELDGKNYTKRSEATEALHAWLEDPENNRRVTAKHGNTELGKYRGLTLGITRGGELYLEAPKGFTTVVGGSAGSIDTVARNLTRRVEESAARLAAQAATMEKTRALLGQDFPKAQELRAKIARHAELEEALSKPKPGTTETDDSESGAPTASTGQGASPAPASGTASSPSPVSPESAGSPFATASSPSPSPSASPSAGSSSASPAAGAKREDSTPSGWKIERSELHDRPVKSPTVKAFLGGSTQDNPKPSNLRIYAKTAHDGYLTDGRLAMELPETERGNLPVDDDLHGQSYKAPIQNMLKDKITSGPLEEYGSHQSGDSNNVYRLLAGVGGDRTAIRAEHKAMVDKHFPGATYHIGKPGGPILARHNGRTVAAIMPLLPHALNKAPMPTMAKVQKAEPAPAVPASSPAASLSPSPTASAAASSSPHGSTLPQSDAGAYHPNIQPGRAVPSPRYSLDKPKSEQEKSPSKDYRREAENAIWRVAEAVNDVSQDLAGEPGKGNDIWSRYAGEVNPSRVRGAHPTPTVGSVDSMVRAAIADLNNRFNRVIDRFTDGGKKPLPEHIRSKYPWLQAPTASAAEQASPAPQAVDAKPSASATSAPAPTAGASAPPAVRDASNLSDGEYQQIIKDAGRLKYLAVQHGDGISKSQLDGLLQKKYGIDAYTARSVSNHLDGVDLYSIGNGQAKWIGEGSEPTLDEHPDMRGQFGVPAAKTPGTPAPTTAASPSRPTTRAFTSLHDAANELQAIRNDLASASPDAGLQDRVDAVGHWLAANARPTGMGATLLKEAQEVHDRLSGGTGHRGTRINLAEPPDSASAPPAQAASQPVGVSAVPEPQAAPINPQPGKSVFRVAAKGRGFNDAIKLLRKRGGKFDPVTKTWTVDTDSIGESTAKLFGLESVQQQAASSQHARSGLSLHYQRLSEQALRYGDRHSARIYMRQAGEVLRFEAKHAPAGGTTAGGKEYKGGQFTPGDGGGSQDDDDSGDDDSGDNHQDDAHEGWEDIAPKQLATILHRAVGDCEGDYEATCSAANWAIKKMFPQAERWMGTYDGEDHEWAKVGNWFVDVTASQFGGPGVLITTELPGEYDGRKTDWTKLDSVDEQRGKAILERAAQIRDSNKHINQYARLADTAQARGDHASARIYRRQAEGG